MCRLSTSVTQTAERLRSIVGEKIAISPSSSPALTVTSISGSRTVPLTM